MVRWLLSGTVAKLTWSTDVEPLMSRSTPTSDTSNLWAHLRDIDFLEILTCGDMLQVHTANVGVSLH